MKQDILKHCLSPDRARSGDKQCASQTQPWEAGLAGGLRTERGPKQRARLSERGGDGVTEGTVRRRSRRDAPRPRVVQFSLTEEEFNEVSHAAETLELARGAFAAEA